MKELLKSKILIKFITAIISMSLLSSCAVKMNNDEKASNPVSKIEIRKNLVPGKGILPTKEVIDQENLKKAQINPDAWDKAWVMTEIDKDLKFLGEEGKSVEKIKEAVKEVVTADVVFKIGTRSLEYSKPIDQSCDITFSDLKKGDIILTKTYNAFSQALDSKESFHHAYLCIEDPTSDKSLSLITTMGAGDPYVNLYPVSWIATHDSEAVILRLYNREMIDLSKVCNFALSSIGSPYNVKFTDKTATDKFYCSQLVWRSYLEGGIDIDYNDFDYNDYGIVLVSDLYKSPYLYIVKHLK